MDKTTQLNILGFGSQAQAWALNLRDSGFTPHILLRENSSSLEKVQSLKFPSSLLSNYSCKDKNSWFFLLTPDQTHRQVLEELSLKIPFGAVIVYAHGQSMSSERLDEVFEDFHHCLLAPKAIASQVRSQFLNQGPLGAVYDIKVAKNSNVPEEDYKKCEEDLSKISKAIGINQGPYKSSFEQETQADLFSEQTLLCSAVPYLTKMSFEKLLEEGFPKELAYLECCYELKLIVDTFFEKGPEEFFKLISPAALVGGEKARSKLFDESYKEKVDQLYEDIKNKKFNDELRTTNPEKLRSQVLEHWENSPLSLAHQELGKIFFQNSQKETKHE